MSLENRVLAFLEELARERQVLHNKYGSWDLGAFARVTLALKRRRVRGLRS